MNRQEWKLNREEHAASEGERALLEDIDMYGVVVRDVLRSICVEKIQVKFRFTVSHRQVSQLFRRVNNPCVAVVDERNDDGEERLPRIGECAKSK